MLRLTEPMMMAIGKAGIIVKMVIDKENVMLTMMVAKENVTTVIGLIE